MRQRCAARSLYKEERNRFSSSGLDCFQLVFPPQRGWPNQISNMILHLFSLALLLFGATPLHCVLNKCTNDQTCVEINKCGEWCARIEHAGSVSQLSENEKAQFRKSFCGFKKNELMVCCEGQSESLVCGITKPIDTLAHSCGKIKVIWSY